MSGTTVSGRIQTQLLSISTTLADNKTKQYGAFVHWTLFSGVHSAGAAVSDRVSSPISPPSCPLLRLALRRTACHFRASLLSSSSLASSRCVGPSPARLLVMAGKEATVYVVDVNPKMGELRGDGKSGLDLVRETLHQHVSQKLIYPKQDEMGIVLVGSDGQQHSTHCNGRAGWIVRKQRHPQAPQLTVCCYCVHVCMCVCLRVMR